MRMDGISQTSDGSQKAVTRTPSSSSLGTDSTKFDASMDVLGDDANRETEKLQSKKRDWRNEFQHLVLQGIDKHQLY
ncbi:hypothetical protein N7509_008200 [Penicillium cosmopolitanum]|uniref:Uncharacterized protein n=1 Tax=Penicillium cosmopolitanum TaxID=1131564 RepID=A0A9W9VM54_9EURO|nr:uncharacterized protein N7509_008200 [Penicillium cosmopolitanum]KAJ5385659.1 hypothetical protein N7509_008200 [Penicillium cosmopolitanum]